MKKKLKLNYEIRFSEFEEDFDKRFAKAKCCIAYVGKNRNKSIISKEAFEKALLSIDNIPVVGNFDKEKNTFGSHDIEVVENEDGKIEIINSTTPFGVVPESASQWFEVCEIDGEQRECLFTDIYLWKRQYGYEHIKKVGILPQSMEICVFNYELKEDGFVSINDFMFEALCILETEDPCFENASISLYSNDPEVVFSLDSLDSYKMQFAKMLEDLRNINVEGDSMDKEKKENFNANENPTTEEELKFDGEEPVAEGGEGSNSGEEQNSGNEQTGEEQTGEITETPTGNDDDDDDGEQTVVVEPESEESIDKNDVFPRPRKKKAYSNQVFASYREKWEKIQSLVSYDKAVADGDDETIGYTVSRLVDFDDKYIYTENVYFDYINDSVDSIYMKTQYATDDSEQNYVLVGQPIKVVKVFVTEEELKTIEEMASREVIKAFNSYKEKYSEEEFESLRLFKIEKDKEQRERDENAIYEKYSNLLGKSKDFVSLWDKKSDYSLDELEKECLCLLGKFSLSKSKEESVEKDVTHMVDNESTPMSIYGDILKHY